MPSQIPGYAYDIFISYRHKDNEYDGWVTEFVKNLERELHATLKENVSIYFDENPHDGLLESHNVDKSLEGKLKCLVFIPIISQTYCDPKSFAWQHEFVAFNKISKEDQHSRDLKLSSGNVASRILPVKIHEIDSSDKSLIESELEGALRSIEFIYKSAGVNRPLTASDNPDRNLNKTFYRDQINKVANVVKEIISSINAGAKLPVTKEEHHSKEYHGFHESSTDSPAGYLINEIRSESISKKTIFNKKIAIGLVLIVFIFGVGALLGWFRPESDRFNNLPTYSSVAIQFPEGMFPDQNPYFTISPDGRTIGYSSEKGIALRSLSDFSTKVLEGTRRTSQLAFSPDGESLAFSRWGNGIYKVGLSGSPVSLVSNMSVTTGIFWGIDGNIYFSAGLGTGGIWRVSENGSEPEQVTFVTDSLGENAHAWPQLLPNGKTLLFTALGPSGGHLDSRVVLQQLQPRNKKILVEKAIFGRYLTNNKLLYANNDGTIFTIEFDPDRLTIIGKPIAVLSGVTTATWGGAAFLSVSETGNVIFLPRQERTLNVFNVFDRSGKLKEGDSISQSVFSRIGHGWSGLNLSPSGDFITTTGRLYGSSDIWILNLGSWDSERITFDIAEDEFPVWSPDGNSIAYSSAQTGASRRLFIKSLGNAANPHLIRTWPRHIHFTSWSPDGKWLAAYDFTTQGTDCWAISIDSLKPVSISGSQANESEPMFSPDGRWVAFQSDESGRNEIYIVSFPALENKRQISIEGGIKPRWDSKGKFIYYLDLDGFLIAHPVVTNADFKRGKPIKLFQANAMDFNRSPDGKKFYLTRRNTLVNQNLNLITNWFQEQHTKTVQ